MATMKEAKAPQWVKDRIKDRVKLILATGNVAGSPDLINDYRFVRGLWREPFVFSPSFQDMPPDLELEAVRDPDVIRQLDIIRSIRLQHSTFTSN